MPNSEHSTDLYTDRRHLTTAAYGNSANLAARQGIYRYQKPFIDLYSWALGHLRWSGRERVVDVGCGNGGYLRQLARDGHPGSLLLGLDLSRGMISDVLRDWGTSRPWPGLAVADIQALPLPNSSCDVALSMHMLYHVPDISQAIRELRRVLRRGLANQPLKFSGARHALAVKAQNHVAL